MGQGHKRSPREATQALLLTDCACHGYETVHVIPSWHQPHPSRLELETCVTTSNFACKSIHPFITLTVFAVKAHHSQNLLFSKSSSPCELFHW